MRTTPRPSSVDPESHAAALETERRLRALIRAEIETHGGLLPFDRFMELALYAPGLGYYAAGAAKLGPTGDFATAPEISPLFGACLAMQCAEVLERIDGGQILELGAGTGTLAVDLLSQLERMDALPVSYAILEPSPDLRERQRKLIGKRLPKLIDRCQWLDRLPDGLRGLVLANEVLDAMPVHRFQIDSRGRTLEIFVGERDGTLTETPSEPRSHGLADAVTALRAAGAGLSAGYSSEINLRLGPWMRAIAQSLDAGLLLAIDYGYPASVYYSPDRSAGTLMCYSRHRAHSDPYRELGLQDITAHVDFSAVARAGTQAGLALAGLTPQAQFLIGCGIDNLLTELTGNEPADLDLMLGVKQLMLPSAMGERFQVAGFAKCTEGPFRGFSVRDLSDRL
jgi:SAM-dependent MidA family methyltransferase